MKKKFKGFTLVELIIVMALTTILMTMIMSFIKPISDLFKNVSDENLHRTVSDGINDYIIGTLRYAKSAQIYTNIDILPTRVKKDDGTWSSDIEEYSLEMAGLGSGDGDKLQVMIIANGDVSMVNGSGDTVPLYDKWANGRRYSGRIWRSKHGFNVDKFYEAMGKPYYGKQNYYITFRNLAPDGATVQQTDDQNVYLTTYTIEEQRVDVSGVLTDDISDPTDNEVILTTQGGGKFVNHGASGASKFKVFNGNVTADLTQLDGSHAGVNTYIVFTLPD